MADESNRLDSGKTREHRPAGTGGTKRLIEQQAALADLQKHQFDTACLTLNTGADRRGSDGRPRLVRSWP